MRATLLAARYSDPETSALPKIVDTACDGVLARGLVAALAPEACVYWREHVAWVAPQQTHEFTRVKLWPAMRP